MPKPELLIAFFLATAVFAYIPGPAMLYASAQTIARGRRAGWLAVLGLHLGGYVHVFAAALGLAVIFETVPVAFVVLKFAGAAYLCWLGLKLILAKDKHALNPEADFSKSPRRAFWDSVVVEILNPKTAVFFLAFLPQFVDPAAAFPIWTQLLILGVIVNIMFSSADVICVVLAATITTRLKKSTRANKIAERLGGTVLVGLGLKLAAQE